MSWFSFSSIKNAVYVVETDVLLTIEKIKQEAIVAESEISAALRWIASNTPAITADIQQVLGLVQVVGIANPQVEAAVVAANAAVGALNVYAAAYNKGTGTAASVIAGYSAFKQAQAAAATATSVAVSTGPIAAEAPIPKPTG
jgi:hypothetical protein